jgi:hypothetical protein
MTRFQRLGTRGSDVRESAMWRMESAGFIPQVWLLLQFPTQLRHPVAHFSESGPVVISGNFTPCG